jgi:1-acyl-sn-glycerol-3-phosphate acyltransferase
LRPFKEGAFVLARKVGCGIIPVIHTGSEKTFDRGSWVLKGKTEIRIRVLDEVSPEVVRSLEIKELMRMVREQMVDGISHMDQEFSER